MNNKMVRFAHFACALLLTLSAGSALADDTEIFVNKDLNAKQPNVLFIVDTSGSMSGKEEVIKSPYDASKDYTGCTQADKGDPDKERIYWSEGSTSSPPACNSKKWFYKTANKCDAAAIALASSSGTAIVNAKQWRKGNGKNSPDQWRDISDSDSYNSSPIECSDDAGKHGKDAGDSDKYASNSNGPWNSSSDVNWNKTYQFYSANYMSWFHHHSDTEEMSRLAIVQDIAKKVVDSSTGINIGLMRFNESKAYGWKWDSEGGRMSLPVSDISANRALFKQRIDQYTHDGYTPLSETLYEAALYYQGKAPYYGTTTHGAGSVAETKNGEGNYISPIEHECQRNYIVLLTDGDPKEDGSADTLITSMTGKSCSDNCLDELAEYMYTKDQRPGVGGVDGTNTIITHTVGFKTSQALLQSTASKGGGNYYTADNYQELQAALTKIFTDIIASTSTFTAPAVSVNAFNRLTHLEQIYFALFRPGEGPAWDGNVKRYKWDSESGKLVDASGAEAVDESTGEYKASAKSIWSGVVDGNDVRLGGAANKMPTTRKAYTHIGDKPTAASPSKLWETAQALHENNTAITTTMLGLDAADTAGRTKLLQWARGVDIDDVDGDSNYTEMRPQMGDPLHTKPMLVAYGSSEANPDLYLFVTTNEGYLHAIETSTGEEKFAFMPQELLPNLKTNYNNEPGGQKTYGLDGPLTIWNTDDGTGGVESDEHVYLYMGMRRGGKHYYALDVTTVSQPKLLWQITGGSGSFAELGETWSRPVVTRMQIGAEASDIKDVLVFGGGYDPVRDAPGLRREDGEGRAIFVVDAKTGDLLWSAGPGTDHTRQLTDMKYSIPSDVRVIDVDNDGLADQFYVGDMGGQLWRFDVNNGKTGADLIEGGVIAELAASDVEDNARRFYYPPDIALISRDGRQYFSISIGSGWREHPLDTKVKDRFYVLRNFQIFGPNRDAAGKAVYTKLTEANLYDASDNLLVEGGTAAIRAQHQTNLNAAAGWYIKLGNGEKVLADSLTINYQVIFTTFQPSGSAVSCRPGEGTGRTYVVSVFDGRPTLDMSGDDTLTKLDRSVQLKRGGIPPAPALLFPGGKPVVLIGPETPLEGKGLNTGNPAGKRQYWRKQ